MVDAGEASSSSSSSIALQTGVLLVLRAAFFLAAQQYLRRSLYSDLRQVIRDETSIHPGGSAAASALHGGGGGGSVPTSPESEFPTSPLSGSGSGSHPGFSLREQLHSLRASSSSSPSLPTSTLQNININTRSVSSSAASTPSGSERKRSAGPGNFRLALPGNSSSTHGNPSRSNTSNNSKKGLAPRLASAVFCASVSECVTLFALILFGGSLSERARLLNWEISLVAVLSLIVLVIPLGMALLFALRSPLANPSSSSSLSPSFSSVSSPSFRRVLLVAMLPFSGWILGLYTVGDWIGKALGVESTAGWSFSLLTATLDRICVPGTLLIATLSGGGAVNSAWEAFEWRERSKSSAVVTEGHVQAALRSLGHTRSDLAARRAELDAVKSAGSEDGSQGFFGRMFSSSPHASKIKSLEAEISGLAAMEAQMGRDLQLMRKRKEISELGQTWHGKLKQAAGYLFSLYCAYRVVISLINLVFGSLLASSSSGSSKTKPSDLVSSVLGRLADAFGWEIDVATWSKVAGLVLIGSIIFVNLNFVLGYVSRVFRATSAGNSASFMLLFLSQLMAVYLITSLIALPSVEDGSDGSANPSAVLLATLPDFGIFQRLFDAVFLLAAGAVFVGRWLHRKIRVDENLGLQDFV